jgi:hypothetical protein
LVIITDPDQEAHLSLSFGSVPDPRSRRGRWHSLTPVRSTCACGGRLRCGERRQLAERGARASGGPFTGPRCGPSPARVAAYTVVGGDRACAGGC